MTGFLAGVVFALTVEAGFLAAWLLDKRDNRLEGAGAREAEGSGLLSRPALLAPRGFESRPARSECVPLGKRGVVPAIEKQARGEASRPGLAAPGSRNAATIYEGVERIDARHRGDTLGGSGFDRYRWALIFSEDGEVRCFRTVTDFKAYCRDRWGVTRWSRDLTNGDWKPEDGDSWVSRKGELWPGRTGEAKP